MKVAVTDHAVLRYMERVMGIDVEAVRAKILAEGRDKMAQKMVNCNLPVAPGMVALVRNGVVVTIRPRPATYKANPHV